MKESLVALDAPREEAEGRDGLPGEAPDGAGNGTQDATWRAHYEEVLLVEDHAAAAAGLRRVAEAAFPGCRVRWASTLAEAKGLLEESWEFGLALVDLALPDGTGVELLEHLQRSRPEVLCVVTTIYDDDDHLFPVLSAGAAGYLLKDQASAALVRQLRAVSEGLPPLSPRVARRMLTFFQQQRGGAASGAGVAAQAAMRSPGSASMGASMGAPAGGRSAGLTRRETEVLSLIARGLQRGEVGALLSVSENTVAKYIKDIYRKLNISSRAEAALEASRRGLL